MGRQALLAGDVIDEAAHPLIQRPVGRELAQQLLCTVGDLLDVAPENRFEKRVSAGKVAVQSSDTDPGPPRDLLERGIHAALAERVRGHLEQLLAIAPRVGPHWPRHDPTSTKKFICQTEGASDKLTEAASA